jgi:hypothetical protein
MTVMSGHPHRQVRAASRVIRSDSQADSPAPQRSVKGSTDRVTNRVTIAIASDGRQRTPVDDASQVRHVAALAIGAVIWLRDEEAAGSNPATPTK